MTSARQMTLPDAGWFRGFRRRLLAWYARNERPLPWRRSREPYAVWVSEIMLQQTQVETVVGYYDRFLRAFPTIEALAAADEEKVLRLWEGLGYYRRARQLHRAAGVIVAEHGGSFPSDFEAVRRLPGIGRYTAGAVLSIAFDARQPILEANTLRLWSRLLGFDGDVQSTEGQRLFWAAAEAVLPRRGTGRLNQALMDLGSEVCWARGPRCEDCPVARDCRANRDGRQGEIPRAKARQRIEEVREAAVVVRRRGKVLLIRWPEGRRWAGLWDFPRFAISAESPARVAEELAENVLTMTGVRVTVGERLHTLRHAVTRFRITLECYEAESLGYGRANSEARFARPALGASGRENEAAPIERRWVRPEELEDYPLSSTGRKLSRVVGSEGLGELRQN
ncbi:MAG: A/G-specific adenine glycosylase [Planctomycetaceae bacterium]|nr:A/G-specific adenine glycosylase [Planctomycetaceae bacterium]